MGPMLAGKVHLPAGLGERHAFEHAANDSQCCRVSVSASRRSPTAIASARSSAESWSRGQQVIERREARAVAIVKQRQVLGMPVGVANSDIESLPFHEASQIHQRSRSMLSHQPGTLRQRGPTLLLAFSRGWPAVRSLRPSGWRSEGAQALRTCPGDREPGEVRSGGRGARQRTPRRSRPASPNRCLRGFRGDPTRPRAQCLPAKGFRTTPPLPPPSTERHAAASAPRSGTRLGG